MSNRKTKGENMPSYTTINDVRGDARIDSRDLIELREAMQSTLDAEDDALDPDERAEMREAIAAIDELEATGLEDWPYGASFIREDTFEYYAQELAEDIGAIPEDASWPATCIDWEQAARELAMDYTSVDFLGYSYYIR
jgi:antirestriction protein